MRDGAIYGTIVLLRYRGCLLLRCCSAALRATAAQDPHLGTIHGYAVTRWIEQLTGNALQIGEASARVDPAVAMRAEYGQASAAAASTVLGWGLDISDQALE